MNPNQFATSQQSYTSSYTSNSAPVGTAPTPTVTVSNELVLNEKRLNGLHEALSQLEVMLVSVLRPSGPDQANGVAGISSQPWSAVVCALRASGFATEAATARVQDLISRLEL